MNIKDAILLQHRDKGQPKVKTEIIFDVKESEISKNISVLRRANIV